ncbi:hypothetical protein ACN47E_000835 [Coniothyrium glycines]
MMLTNSITFLAACASFLPATYAGILQKDFTGIGHIHVWASADWRTATPDSKVGCLNKHGKFVKDESKDSCAVFERLDQFPYTLSSSIGNCTFDDETQEKNTDSVYGAIDNAWNCKKKWTSTIYDELYTIDGFPHVFLCFGDVACYYDGKRTPKSNETLPLWQYRWGSQQMGITPGHVQLQLVWDNIGDLPKREGESDIPGPRMQVTEDVQIPLLGKRSKML